MMRTWAELDQLEKRSGLSFLREPDAGFVWAAFRWARGAKLEDVLDSADSLTPGDFVRSVKQLIDLLDQIAAAADQSPSPRPAPTAEEAAPATDAAPDATDAAPDTASVGATPAAEDGEQPRPEVSPRDRDVAATARAAISALRRGVVAYTSLTD
jgi:hypothetical protein